MFRSSHVGKNKIEAFLWKKNVYNSWEKWEKDQILLAHYVISANNTCNFLTFNTCYLKMTHTNQSAWEKYQNRRVENTRSLRANLYHHLWNVWLEKKINEHRLSHQFRILTPTSRMRVGWGDRITQTFD